MSPRSPLLVCSVLVVAACASDPPAADTDAASSSESSTSNASSESSESSTAADSSSSGDLDESSSESTGAPPPDLDCPQGTAVLTLDGDASEHMALGVGLDAFGLVEEFGERGWFFLRIGGDDIYPTTPQQGSGHVRVPADADARANEWLCFDDTSQYVTNGDGITGASLHNLASLGTCPGTPVEGTLELCFDASCGTPGVSATIDGASFDAPLGTQWGAGPGDGAFIVSADFGKSGGDGSLGIGGELELRATEVVQDSGMHESAVDDGWIVMPLGAPDAGAIYCAGEGSSLQYEGGEFFTPHGATLTGLSRLGSCAELDGDGTGSLCVHMGF